MRAPADLVRELNKVADTVTVALHHFEKQAEADAALHMAAKVRPNPLTVAMGTALDDLIRLINELNEEVTDAN